MGCQKSLIVRQMGGEDGSLNMQEGVQERWGTGLGGHKSFCRAVLCGHFSD